jgi:hypothetical protein
MKISCQLALVLPAFGQQTGLNGVVSDVQGGVISGATVQAKETDGSSFTTTTNSQGSYVVPNLVAVEYTIKASASGFGPCRRRSFCWLDSSRRSTSPCLLPLPHPLSLASSAS